LLYMFLYFFFQAEDGIRDRNVTGVQTCALPIFISFALEQDPTLKQDANFLQLCQDYGVDSLQYAIEDNEQYQTDLLPMLDKKASQLRDISKYTDLLSHLLDSFIINDEAENAISRPSVPLRRRSHVHLEDYFDKAHLKTLTDIEK